MKAIQCSAILTSASTRSDGSLGLRFATPELSGSEMADFFGLLNKNLKVLIQPVDDVPESILEVNNELGFKTPSQRLRAVLFIGYQQHKPADTTFDEYYGRRMDEIIERQKKQLDPE